MAANNYAVMYYLCPAFLSKLMSWFCHFYSFNPETSNVQKVWKVKFTQCVPTLKSIENILSIIDIRKTKT